MTATERERPRHASRSWLQVTAQWLAVVGPPAAAFAQQQLAYSLVSPSCTRHVTPVVQLPTLLALAVIAISTLYSWRQWTRRNGELPPGDITSTRFFAVVGLMMSGISVVLMLAQWLPTLFLHPCLQ